MSPRSQSNGNNPVPLLLRSPSACPPHRPPPATSGTLLPPTRKEVGCASAPDAHATVTNLRDLPNTGKRRPLRGGPSPLTPDTRCGSRDGVAATERERGKKKLSHMTRNKDTSFWGLTEVCMWARGTVAAASHARRGREEAVCFTSAEPLRCTLRISKTTEMTVASFL